MADTIINYELTLDIQDKISNKFLNVRRGDVGSTLTVTLINGSEDVDLSEATVVALAGVKPDGKTLYQNCEVINNKAIYTFTEQTTNVEGIVACQIVVMNGSAVIYTSPMFSMDVRDRIITDADAVESSDDFSALLGYTADLVELIDTAQRLLIYHAPITVSNNNPPDDITDTEKYRFWYNQVNRTMYVLRTTYQGGPVYWERCNVKTTISSAPAPARSPNNVACQYNKGDIWVGFDSYFLELYVCDHAIKRTEDDVWWYEYTWLRVNEHYYTKDEVNNLLDNKENISNKIEAISSLSTNTQYPSALAVKNYVDSVIGNIETALSEV